MAVLKVNGSAVAAPSEMRVELVNVGSDGQRSVSGRLAVDRVAVKRRVRLKWAVLTSEQMGALIEAMEEIFFEVVCPDPASGARAMTCRCADRAMGVLRIVGDEPIWTDVEMVWEER